MSQFRKDVSYVVRGITTTFAILLAIATLAGASLMGLALFLQEDSSLRAVLLSGVKAKLPVIALMTTVYWSLLTYLKGIAQKIGTRFAYLSGAIAFFALIVSFSVRP